MAILILFIGMVVYYNLYMAEHMTATPRCQKGSVCNDCTCAGLCDANNKCTK